MAEKSKTTQVTVTNRQGLHARPAHALVTAASRFTSDITLIRDGEGVDGKSILSVLTLAAEQGTELTLKATGDDAEQALSVLAALFENGFGEDEEERETSADGRAREARE